MQMSARGYDSGPLAGVAAKHREVELISYRAMIRALIAMSAAVAACGAPATAPPQATISNAASGAPASPCELGWIEQADRLVVTEDSNGHFGYSEHRAELRVEPRGAELAGTLRASFKRYPNKVPETMSAEVRAPRAQIAALLAAMGHGLDAPEDDPNRSYILVHDSSQTRLLAVEVGAEVRGVAHRARLAGRGEVEPGDWSVHGCERKLSHEGRVRVSRAYAKLEGFLRRDAILSALDARTSHHP